MKVFTSGEEREHKNKTANCTLTSQDIKPLRRQNFKNLFISNFNSILFLNV